MKQIIRQGIQTLIHIFEPAPKPAPSPFDVRKCQTFTLKDVAPVNDVNVIDMEWGNQVRKVKVTENKELDNYEWALDDIKKKKRLKPMDLDDIDMKVIKENKLSANNYKMFKPYVMAGMSYPEIVPLVPFKLSTIQQMGRFIKKAEKIRRGVV